MKARQSSIPRRWLVADERLGDGLWPSLRKLPRGSGVLVLYRDLPRRERARLVAKIRHVAGSRGLTLVDEAERKTGRVHDLRELRRASLARLPLIFLSPMFATASHPKWAPMPKMRAATLVRLAPMPVIALGGMDAQRFRRLQRVGFHGWAGIDAWLRT
jgi:thiamine-phosphate pyrophosphorylase